MTTPGVTRYKQKILSMLYASEPIKALILGGNTDLTDETWKTRIVPSLRNYKALSDGTTYIFVDIKTIEESPTISDYAVRIEALSHSTKNETVNGCRTDLLSEEADKLFSGSRAFGIGKLQKQNSDPFFTVNDFIGRRTIYLAKEYSTGR